MNILEHSSLLQNKPTTAKKAGRTYRACVPCRKRKVKCDLGDPDSPLGPPCAKCRRESRDCVFTEERSTSSPDPSSVSRKHIDDHLTSPSSSAKRNSNTESRQDWVTSGTYSRNQVGENTAEDRVLSQSLPPLDSSVMRTVVTSSNDALNILFDVVEQQGDSIEPINHEVSQNQDMEQRTPTILASTKGPETGPMMVSTRRSTLSKPDLKTLRIWADLCFVRQGWFSAQEACSYMDLFFEQLSPLSPILTDFYSRHENHEMLVHTEPLLCSVILMIASRYFVLPGPRGATRGLFIHHRLWQYCQQLIQRVILGQEKLSRAKTRTIGTVESLLLIVEWHPRSLHLPPESDGWDANLTIRRPLENESAETEADLLNPKQWRKEVMEPTKKSDRMSWMLLGCALTLAQELGLFDDDAAGNDAAEATLQPPSTEYHARRIRMRSLLYIYINHVAARLDHSPLLPLVNYMPMQTKFATEMEGSQLDAENWQKLMISWIKLTKIMRSIASTCFPSTSVTRQLLSSGRYSVLLDHFQPLLQSWKESHLDETNLPERYIDILSMEYQYARIYVNSLAVQASVERTPRQNGRLSPIDRILYVEQSDQVFIREVIDGSRQILDKALSLAARGQLLYSTVRVFSRITSASIFLLKAIGLGVSSQELNDSLTLLEEIVEALKLATVDDMHLGPNYGTLLAVHVRHLRRKVVTRPAVLNESLQNPGTSFVVPPSPFQSLGTRNNTTHTDFGGDFEGPIGNDNIVSLLPEDWLALPFDPSMTIFAFGNELNSNNMGWDFEGPFNLDD